MKRLVSVAAGLAFAAQLATAAAVSEPRWEFSLSVGGAHPSMKAFYGNSFVIPFLYGGSDVAVIQQSVRIEAEPAAVFSARAGRLISGRWGIELAVDHFQTALSGRNPDYAVDLQYVSMMPPDYTPREIDRIETRPWPDTTGTMSQTVLSLAVFYRIDVLRTVHLDLSAGPAFTWLKIEAAGLGFSDYWLGGHSVLFNQDYSLPYAISSSFMPGFRIACRLQVELARGLWLGLDAAGLAASRGSAAAELRTPDSETSARLHRTMAAISSLMGLPKADPAPSYVRLSAGLIVRL
jgi:hypothetical protein